MSLTSLAVFSAVAVGAAGIGWTLGSSLQDIENAMHPPSKGEGYLRDMGFKHISGGHEVQTKACPGFARLYDATTPRGFKIRLPVCFSINGARLSL